MAGIYVPWLVDAARLTGYPVVEVAGWRTRGHGGLAAVEGVVCHHTGGPKTGEMPSLRVVRDGRADLAGPLSQLGLGRSGTIYVVAAGVAWHAGPSAWDGLSGLNSRFLGVEAESAGDGVWTTEQLDCYPRLVAALLHYMRRPPTRCAAHREVALPKGRKPDPTGIDMAPFRARVTALLADPPGRIPRAGATKPKEDPVSWTREQGAPPIPDYYRDGLDPLPDPATALAWATAHAAHARDEARAARAGVTDLTAKVAALTELVESLAHRP